MAEPPGRRCGRIRDLGACVGIYVHDRGGRRDADAEPLPGRPIGGTGDADRLAVHGFVRQRLHWRLLPNRPNHRWQQRCIGHTGRLHRGGQWARHRGPHRPDPKICREMAKIDWNLRHEQGRVAVRQPNTARWLHPSDRPPADRGRGRLPANALRAVSSTSGTTQQQYSVAVAMPRTRSLPSLTASAAAPPSVRP